MCGHRLKSFREHVANQTKHLIFHTDASSLVQQSAVVILDKTECDGYKSEYGLGSSSDVIRAFRHRPCPSAGTCLHDNDPSGRTSCTSQGWQAQGCKHVRNHRRFPCQ